MNLGWCVSGAGMGARAVFEAHEAGLIRTRLMVVLLDRPTPMIEYCHTHDIACVVSSAAKIQHDAISCRNGFGLDWLGLTFNRLLKQAVIDAYEGKIFNLHLAMLPQFPGFNPIRKALEAKLCETGATVHLIDAGVDTGPILIQSKCPIAKNDTEATLGRKLFASAVPLLLQVVRTIESRSVEPLSYEAWRPAKIDPDIQQFSQEYMARI